MISLQPLRLGSSGKEKQKIARVALCETGDLRAGINFLLVICIGSVFGNVCWVSSSCFVLASTVSVPMEMRMEVASVSRELCLDQLLLPEVSVGR